MEKRYSENQRAAALLYFAKKNGRVIEEKEKPSGNLHFLVKFENMNPTFKIDNDYLYYFEHKAGHWNWKSVAYLGSKEAGPRESRLSELKESIK